MPRLARGREPTWITLTEATKEEPACRVLVRPYTIAGKSVGLLALRNALECGATAPEGNIAFSVGLATWAVMEWEGVGDEAGEPVPCTRDDVRLLMEQHEAAFAAFERLYVTPAIEGDNEKNGSSPSPHGTSPAGAAPRKTKKKTKAKVRRGAGAATATAAPAKAANARTAATSRKATKAAPSGV